jgi:hypothetical protein
MNRNLINQNLNLKHTLRSTPLPFPRTFMRNTESQSQSECEYIQILIPHWPRTTLAPRMRAPRRVP